VSCTSENALPVSSHKIQRRDVLSLAAAAAIATSAPPVFAGAYSTPTKAYNFHVVNDQFISLLTCSSLLCYLVSCSITEEGDIITFYGAANPPASYGGIGGTAPDKARYPQTLWLAVDIA